MDKVYFEFRMETRCTEPRFIVDIHNSKTGIIISLECDSSQFKYRLERFYHDDTVISIEEVEKDCLEVTGGINFIIQSFNVKNEDTLKKLAKQIPTIAGIRLTNDNKCFKIIELKEKLKSDKECLRIFESPDFSKLCKL